MLFLLIQPQMPGLISNRGRLDPSRYPKVEPQKFSPLPMPMAELYAYLLEEKLVTPIFMKSKDCPPLLDFDPFKKCEHYFGLERHTLEECEHFRHQIQYLIDNKKIQFDNAAGPNVITKPLPPY